MEYLPENQSENLLHNCSNNCFNNVCFYNWPLRQLAISLAVFTTVALTGW
jgi:hypothetical protein